MLVKNKRPLPGICKRILLIQLGDIGDVVLTMPAVRALRERFPESSLVIAVREKARGLVDDCPWVDGVVSIDKKKRIFARALSYEAGFIKDLRRWRFDTAVDLRTGTRGAILARLSGAKTRIGRYADDGELWRNRMFTHLVRPPLQELNQYVAEHHLNILSPLKLKPVDRIPSLVVSNARRKKGVRLFREAGIPTDRPVIGFHPFSLWKYKELDIDQCVSLVNYLCNAYPVSVIITGAPNERERAAQVAARCGAEVFNLAGKTSIGDLPAIFELCRLFIGVDTAALHIAAAVGVPTAGIFGPSSPVSWAPRGKQHVVVSKDLDCVPCRRKGCQDSERSRCIETLTIEDILEKITPQLSRIGSTAEQHTTGK